MTEPRKSRAGVLWLALFVAVVYAASVYNSFFSTRLAFLYDPASDRLFELELMLSLSSCNKWTPLIPFQECLFGEVVSVQYRGKFSEKLKEVESDRVLMKTDSEAWLQKQKRKVQKLLAEGVADLELWDLTYHTTNAVRFQDRLPQRLSSLADLKTGDLPDVFPVDVVLGRSTLKVRRQEFEIVRNAVFFRGRAAH